MGDTSQAVIKTDDRNYAIQKHKADPPNSNRDALICLCVYIYIYILKQRKRLLRDVSTQFICYDRARNWRPLGSVLVVCGQELRGERKFTPILIYPHTSPPKIIQRKLL